MKLRTVCTTVAIALAACAVSPTSAFADAFVPTEQQSLSFSEQIANIKADIATDTYSCVELSERIDILVKRIDTLLDNGAENHLELIRDRKLALDLKSQIKCDHAAEEAAENGTTLTSSSCNCGGGSVASVGQSYGGGAQCSSGGGGGGHGGGGLGRIGGVALIGAAIAIPIAVTDDKPNFVASPH